MGEEKGSSFLEKLCSAAAVVEEDGKPWQKPRA
jgi:hypothetical protein